MRALNEWFRKNQRQFPWRLKPTPYQVWISEVMLQQTRASVVIPYFEKWMAIFPDVATLASAPIEQVIKIWEGLGYYSRARNLHQGAKQIVEKFAGEIPSKREDLMTIQGLGPYTIGAILSFGFKKRAPAVDGNVTRVLTRFFCIEENVCKQSVKKKILQGAEAILDPDEPWVTAEALIELGATICTRTPRCEICPLQTNCLGKEKAPILPIKNEDKPITVLRRAVVWLEADGHVLIKKGEKGQIMEDLYQFPYFEMEEVWSLNKIAKAIQVHFDLQIEFLEKLPTVLHHFTRFKAYLYPLRFRTATKTLVSGYEWTHRTELTKLPFSAGHRRILEL